MPSYRYHPHHVVPIRPRILLDNISLDRLAMAVYIYIYLFTYLFFCLKKKT